MVSFSWKYSNLKEKIKLEKQFSLPTGTMTTGSVIRLN